MRTIKSASVAVASAVICSLMGCAVDEPATGSAESAVLDASGNWYGLRTFGPAMSSVASAISFTPFAVNELGSTPSLAKVSTGYEQITGILGETTVGTVRTHVARWATRVLTEPSDSITAITSAQLKAALVGNANGSLSTSTPPTGCTTLAGVTVKPFVVDALDPSAELLRAKLGVSDQGLYTYCKGTVVVSRASGSLVGQVLNASNVVVAFTLTPTCASTDGADVCIGKQAAVSGQIGLASKLAINASISQPTVDGITDADANIRATPPTYPLTLNLTLVNDTAQSQMAAFSTRILGAGASAFEAGLVAAGATACSTLTPLACP